MADLAVRDEKTLHEGGYRYRPQWFGLKEEFVAGLRVVGHELTGFGADSLNPEDDYPDFIARSRKQ
jgi:hypothetical protein